jgi:hypothetical protein
MTASEPLGLFGSFSQLNSGVTGTELFRENACVPASVANGLQFLSNFYSAPSLMLPGYDTVNTLATGMGTAEDGTTYSGMASGTSSYFVSQGLSTSFAIAGGETTPFMVTLYDWLLADYAVEFWIAWDGSTKAHCLTLTSITLDTDSGGAFTGTGTMSFIDPYGGPISTDGNTSSAVAIGGVSFVQSVGPGASMHIIDGYFGGAAANPTDPDNTSGASTGMLINDLAEKFTPAVVTPEPSILVLFAAGVLMLASRRRRVGRPSEIA